MHQKTARGETQKGDLTRANSSVCSRASKRCFAAPCSECSEAKPAQRTFGFTEHGSFTTSLSPRFARAGASLASVSIATDKDRAQKNALSPRPSSTSAATGYMPGSVRASAAERAKFGRHPGSTWAIAPGGTDAIYKSLEGMGGIKEVLPTLPMQGAYRNDAGQWEFNPGFSARPNVDYAVGPDGRPMLTQEAWQTLQFGETLRSAMDVQQAGAGHQVFLRSEGNSLFAPRRGPSNPDTIQRIQGVSAERGLPNVSDTGQGLTITNFADLPPELVDNTIREIVAAARARRALRADVEGIYLPLAKLWQQGEGALTRHVLNKLEAMPENLRDAYDNNPYIAEKARRIIERNQEWFRRWDIGRTDVQRFYDLLGNGRGWRERMGRALRRHSGGLPIIVGTFLGALEAARQDESEQSPSL